GADVGEQMNVTRTVDGQLVIEGLVESDKRKQEILDVLSTVANNPAIKINVQTIEEAAKALAKQKQIAEPGSESRVEVNNGPLAAESDLREYFSRNGGDVDAQIHRFSSAAINRSQNALFQASALNRLANRFTPAQMKSLDPSA